MAGRDVTHLLRAAESGDEAATRELLPLVYGELRSLAGQWMSRLPPGRTLQPTAVVHEAYLRLVRRGGVEEPGWADRAHFFLCAARGMRDILVEDARRKASLRAGGAEHRVDVDSADVAADDRPVDLLALDDALERLEREAPLRWRIVMLRFYGGLGMEDTAAAIGMPLRTLEREWSYLRARLHRELGGGDS